MKTAFRQSMAWLHTWAGLVVGWVLYFIFLTGTAGYFDNEITRWMQPERPLAASATDDLALVARVQTYMTREMPDALDWSLYFPEHEPLDPEVWWNLPESASGQGRSWGTGNFDPVSGQMLARKESVARRTGGGVALYRLHYDLRYVSRYAGNLIVGICTMLMLIAILTGIVTHKKIFKNFFTFQPGKGQRSWLDAHNVISVTALPFFLMITLSGLFFFMYLYVPAGMYAAYGIDRQWEGGDVNPLNPRANARFDSVRSEREAVSSGIAAPLIDLRGPVVVTQNRRGKGSIHFIKVTRPGDSSSEIEIGRRGSGIADRDQLRFSGATGVELPVSRGKRGVAWWIQDVFIDLHEGLFAGWSLRWLYFLSGLLGGAMIATGLVLWTAKRRQKQGEAVGFRLVEILNIGTIAGLPVGIAAYFWANRLLPLEMDERAAWEMHGLFIAWAAMLLWAAVRKPGKAWVEQLWIAAAAFGLLPILNVLTTDRHLGVTIPAGDWVLAGFDLTMLAIGLFFAAAAWKVRRRWEASRQNLDMRAQVREVAA